MLSLVIAVDENFGFANEGTLPWKCQEDLQNFKLLTDNKHVIMGRKTWESIPQKLFTKNKRCTIVTRDKSFKCPYDNVRVVNDISEINSGIIIGGKDLTMKIMDKIQEINLTVVKGNYKCDIFFKELKELVKDYNLVSSVESKQCTYYLYRH